MEQEKFEEMVAKVDAVYERVVLHRKALSFIQDTTDDDQLMANLSMIAMGIERTENMLNRIMCRPEEHSDDIPY